MFVGYGGRSNGGGYGGGDSNGYKKSENGGGFGGSRFSEKKEHIRFDGAPADGARNGYSNGNGHSAAPEGGFRSTRFQ